MTEQARTAIVTGASQGIGAGIAQRLLEQGYNVVANSRRISATSPFAPSKQLALVDGDIGEPETAQAVAERAIDQFGSIDLLVVNAGRLIAKPFTDYTQADFESLVSTILGGFFFISQKAAGQMLKQGAGHIVSISTNLVSHPSTKVPAALQILTKGGLHAATRALALEYATSNIRVNAIAAGAIDTPMHKDTDHDFLKSLQPVGRIGTVKDIVDGVMYLNEATFVTGEVLYIDGGAHSGEW